MRKCVLVGVCVLTIGVAVALGFVVLNTNEIVYPEEYNSLDDESENQQEVVNESITANVGDSTLVVDVRKDMEENCDKYLYAVLSNIYLAEDKEFADLDEIKQQLYEFYGLSKDSTFWQNAHGPDRFQTQVKSIDIISEEFDDDESNGLLLHFVADCVVDTIDGVDSKVVIKADLIQDGKIVSLDIR